MKKHQIDTHVWLPVDLYRQVVALADAEDDTIRHEIIVLLREALRAKREEARRNE
jgi:hypothetical protein